VDLGPFKHRIDDGLELRKAAFECLDILLSHVPQVLQQQPAFLAALESGLKDHQDVKAPAHLMLAKLAASPGEDLSEQMMGDVESALLLRVLLGLCSTALPIV
jgi:cullin-associated NEDD8-dissociated protein 1